MTRTLTLDQDLCIRCNLCVDTLPAVFRTGKDDLAEVYNQNGASADEIQQVIDACPVACIGWEP
jgi:ferredoxin